MEIARDARGEIPRELIRSAYLASVSGTIGLVLDDVATELLDRVLDDVVSSTPGAHGVVYCTPQSLAELLSDRGVPEMVFAPSAPVRKLLSGWPVRVVPANRAAAALKRLAGRKSVIVGTRGGDASLGSA